MGMHGQAVKRDAFARRFLKKQVWQFTSISCFTISASWTWGRDAGMRYEAPATSEEAARFLAAEKGTACILAGGTDLLVRMKMGMTEPDLIVDIKKIPEVWNHQQDG